MSVEIYGKVWTNSSETLKNYLKHKVIESRMRKMM